MGKNKIKLVEQHENITQNVLFGNAVLCTLLSGKKYDVIPQNGDNSTESNVRILVFRKSPLSKCNVVTELIMGKVHLQIMLSDVG
jgi:hypothetical protein